jgi:hypothetical protein
MPRKTIAWAVSIVGWGGYLLVQANRLAGYIGFLSLPEDARKALVLMSHVPTLASLTLIVIGMIGIIALGYEYGFFRKLAIIRKDHTSNDSASPSIIPTPSTTDTHRYMTAYEALHCLSDDSKWGDQIRQYVGEMERITIRKNPLIEAPSEFKRIAEQGRIETLGRLNGDGPHVLIPETYWMSAILVLSDNPVNRESVPAVPNPDGIPRYKDIKIVRADVKRAWPDKGQK